ncbi:MAG: flippase [Bacteroidales bacterium]|nr:flippase [Bacteroidales bacterium]
MIKKLTQGLINTFKHKGVQKYSINTIWLVSEKITGMLLGFFVGVWVARYLGPAKLGMLDYVFALTALLTPLSALGLSSILSRDIVRDPKTTNILLNTCLGLRILGGCAVSVIILSYLILKKNDPIYVYIAIFSLTELLTKSGEVFEDYFRAVIKTKYIFISRLIGYILSSVLKVIFILMGFSIVYFAGARMSFMLFTLIPLYFFITNNKAKIAIKYFQFQKAIELLKESWPLIFSGIFALIYLQIDKIMIEGMLNNYELGQYSVAVKLSGLWFFIPLNIRASILPAFVNAKKTDEKLYYNRLNQVFGLMALLSYIIIVPFAFFSESIVSFIYGTQFAPAGKVLAIHIFSLLFFFQGIGRGLWTTNESHFKFDLFSNVVAGLLNVAGNFILLPKIGIMGAAYSTLLSYSFTYIFANLFFKPARKIFVMQLKALFLISIAQSVRSYVYK